MPEVYLDWPAKHPRVTQRVAMHVGALCREMTNTAVAKAERLHDSTVKDLDRISMPQQVARAGLPTPRAIGVDEMAIRKGHDYRIVVSDLDRRRPIWVGGKGRTDADRDLFFAALGAKKTARIPLAAMDMWRPFRASLMRHKRVSSSTRSTSCVTSAMRSTPSAAARTAASPPRTAPSSRDSAISCSPTASTSPSTAAGPSPSGWQHRLPAQRVLGPALGLPNRERGTHLLHAVATEPHVAEAHALREIRGDDRPPLERHRFVLAPENKVSLGVVEGLNNKIRVLQRRAYGYRDEDYLKLKIVAAFLPPLTRSAEKDPR